MDCWSDPLGHLSCYINSPPQISWLSLDPKLSRRLKFRTSVSALLWYSHTCTRSWMDVTFITHISGLSFFSTEMWAVFWESASCIQETMLLNCCQLLHWNTIPSDRQEKQFLTYLPQMCQRLAQCKLCVLDKKVLSYTAISLGKAKNNIIAECCAATLLHVNISVCEAYFQSYKKSI